MKITIALIFAVVLLCACNPLKYSDPTSGDRARVRFVGTSRPLSVLESYGDEQCQTDEQEMMRLRNGPLVRSSPKRLGLPLWNNTLEYADNASKEVYVKAGANLNFIFAISGADPGQQAARHGYISKSCGIPFSITLEPGKDYEILLSGDRSEDGVQCRLSVSEFSMNGSTWEKIPKSYSVNKTDGCKNAFEKIVR